MEEVPMILDAHDWKYNLPVLFGMSVIFLFIVIFALIMNDYLKRLKFTSLQTKEKKDIIFFGKKN